MKGSHAPSLRTLVRRLLETELGLRGASILCACSGGPDSTAMLHVLAGLRPALDLTLTACAVDHGLRREAGAEIELAREVAASAGVPFEVVGLHVPRGPNLMARAREARYAALREVRARLGASLIATGHTADDRAETVVMRLLRGAGPRGLAVLPPRTEDLLRPLVRARRADVLLHLARAGVRFASDPSNEDRSFLRVRVRKEIMPLFEGLSPQIVASLCSLADELAEILPTDDPLASLGRRQRQMVERALRLGPGGARVRTSDREEVFVQVENGRKVLREVVSPKPAPAGRRGTRTGPL
ncbi:MAG: tRNA lysidine(34) synthetase TilS [Myxococcales bacterium]|nr:tRNA lysidine(34) synthetase TilS [Myxococcales bacterium]